MYSKPAIFVVISVLVIALISGSFTPYIVFAEPPSSDWRNSKDCSINSYGMVYCCWTESGAEYCQTCVRIPYDDLNPEGGWECTTKEKQSLEQPPTAQPFDPAAPLQGGVLEEPPTPPAYGPDAPLQGGVLEEQEPPVPPTFAPGFLERQQLQPLAPTDQGAAELPPPATEGSQPASLGEEPLVPVCQEGLEFNEDLGFCVPTECPEGQELNEETGICVLEEQPAEQQEQTAEEPEEPQPNDEEQTPDQEDNSEENNSIN